MLGARASWLREQMDDAHCDPTLLHNTYRQFARVNALVSGWRRVFENRLAPRLHRGATILDVGCGGGDLARRLRLCSERCGTPAAVTAIDRDPRAVRFARSRPPLSGVEFRELSAEDLARSGERFDVVVSNHLLHHLADDQLPAFLETTADLALGTVIHNDLRRHPAAYAAFSLAGPLFPRSFIVEDGLRSIRRAFTAEELGQLAPPGWKVEGAAPFRHLVILEK